MQFCKHIIIGLLFTLSLAMGSGGACRKAMNSGGGGGGGGGGVRVMNHTVHVCMLFASTSAFGCDLVTQSTGSRKKKALDLS